VVDTLLRMQMPIFCWPMMILRSFLFNPGFYRIFLKNYGIALRKGSSILDSMEMVSPRLANVWRERCRMPSMEIPLKLKRHMKLREKNPIGKYILKRYTSKAD
jgi:hypothetical protein